MRPQVKTYALVVFQHRPLKDKVPRLPSPKVFASFSEVTFFAAGREFLGITQYIGGEKCDHFILILDRKVD